MGSRKVRSTISRLKGTFWATSQVVDRGRVVIDEQKEGDVEVGEFEGPVASVTVGGGMTVNMGNYQSARVDVSITMPCYPEEVGDVYAHLRGAVEARVKAETDELVAARKKGSPA